MPGMANLSIRVSAQYRDMSGRFARFDCASAIEKRLLQYGNDAARKLANASPVRTGALRQNWRPTYQPSDKTMTVSNDVGYAGYVTFGTRTQAANPALQHVVRDELPDLGTVAREGIGKDVSLSLRRG